MYKAERKKKAIMTLIPEIIVLRFSRIYVVVFLPRIFSNNREFLTYLREKRDCFVLNAYTEIYTDTHVTRGKQCGKT